MGYTSVSKKSVDSLVLTSTPRPHFLELGFLLLKWWTLVSGHVWCVMGSSPSVRRKREHDRIQTTPVPSSGSTHSIPSTTSPLSTSRSLQVKGLYPGGEDSGRSSSSPPDDPKLDRTSPADLNPDADLSSNNDVTQAHLYEDELGEGVQHQETHLHSSLLQDEDTIQPANGENALLTLMVQPDRLCSVCRQRLIDQDGTPQTPNVSDTSPALSDMYSLTIK